jgi:hypothetical protein
MLRYHKTNYTATLLKRLRDCRHEKEYKVPQAFQKGSKYSRVVDNEKRGTNC